MAPTPAREVALQFLDAYWRGDVPAALALCHANATLKLPESLALTGSASVERVLPEIVGRIYPRFVGGRFDVRIDAVLDGTSQVAVEYTATGSLVRGGSFRCRYVVVMDVDVGRLRSIRPYTDTRYVSSTLMADDR